MLAQTERSRLRDLHRFGHVKSPTIIGNRDGQLIGLAGQCDVMRGLCVLGTVGERFLHNPIGRRFNFARSSRSLESPATRSVTSPRAWPQNPLPASHRFDQPQVVEHGGMQPPRQAPNLVIDAPAQVSQFLGLRWAASSVGASSKSRICTSRDVNDWPISSCRSRAICWRSAS